MLDPAQEDLADLVAARVQEVMLGRQRQPAIVPEYLTQQEAAYFLNTSNKTMENLRLRGAGPPFIRFGGRIRYRVETLRAWMLENEVEPRGDGK